MVDGGCTQQTICFVAPPTQREMSLAAANDKETPWIDAWIRWERDSKAQVDDSNITDDDANNDDGALSSAETVAPTETFSFRYSVPVDSDNNDDATSSNSRDEQDVVETIDMELRGFPSESEQIWNSTGLTLWGSSRVLCDYLVEHPYLLRQPKRILEVRKRRKFHTTNRVYRVYINYH